MSELQNIVNHAQDNFKKAIAHLEGEMLKIRAGKANPAMLNGIMVNAYGTQTPLSGVCNITTPDSRTLALQPWDKSQIPDIERAIMTANLGLNPQNDGEVIRILVPPLTEERRKELVKQAKAEVEHAKVSIRNIRRDGNESLRSLKKEGVSEDEIGIGEDQIQKMTDEYVKITDQILSYKEKEILTV